jgi:hypothetical protein
MFGNEQVIAVVAFILICSAVLTVPTAAFVLWLYGRSVRRGMTQPQAGQLRLRVLRLNTINQAK